MSRPEPLPQREPGSGAAAPTDPPASVDVELQDLGLLPVTIRTLCRPSNATSGGTRHPVTIAADWTVETGHDLPTERIAAALGARLSCLDLVDATVPAVRHFLDLQLRRQPPPITSTDGKSWTVRRKAACCSQYRTAVEAVQHVGTAQHAAYLFSAPTRQVAAFARHWEPLLQRAAAGPRDPVGRSLWQHGFSIEYVHKVEQQMAATEPLPLDMHLAILARNPDPTWLGPAAAAMAAHNPKAALALVWDASKWERIPLAERIEWLAQPLPQQLALTLATARIPVQDVHDLATAQGATPVWAATQIASWLRADIRLTPAEIHSLAEDAPGLPAAPPPSAIKRLRHLATLHGHTDKEIALALVKHGHVTAAARALNTADTDAN